MNICRRQEDKREILKGNEGEDMENGDSKRRHMSYRKEGRRISRKEKWTI